MKMQDDKRLLGEILEAIQREEFEMHYQPIVSTKKRKTVGYEALARWNRLKLGFFNTEEVILILERNRKTILLDKLVTKLVMKDMAKNFQIHNLKLSINLCVSSLLSSSFRRDFMKLIRHYKVNLKLIVIEVIESDQIINLKQFQKQINKYVKHGIRFSLDDYGTGFNGFEVLKGIKFHELKIDKTFINNINSSINFNLLERLIELGKSNELDVVIEGVETKEQFKIIQETNCDYVQGYYFSKPNPVEEITNFIEYYKLSFQKSK